MKHALMQKLSQSDINSTNQSENIDKKSNSFTYAQKLLLTIKALKEFHEDIAIPYALIASRLFIIVLIITSIFAFTALLTRALDIEAEESHQIVFKHNQFLKIKLQNDAPEDMEYHHAK